MTALGERGLLVEQAREGEGAGASPKAGLATLTLHSVPGAWTVPSTQDSGGKCLPNE